MIHKTKIQLRRLLDTIRDANPVSRVGVVAAVTAAGVLGVAFGPAAYHLVMADVVAPVVTFLGAVVALVGGAL